MTNVALAPGSTSGSQRDGKAKSVFTACLLLYPQSSNAPLPSAHRGTDKCSDASTTRSLKRKFSQPNRSIMYLIKDRKAKRGPTSLKPVLPPTSPFANSPGSFPPLFWPSGSENVIISRICHLQRETDRKYKHIDLHLCSSSYLLK